MLVRCEICDEYPQVIMKVFTDFQIATCKNHRVQLAEFMAKCQGKLEAVKLKFEKDLRSMKTETPIED